MARGALAESIRTTIRERRCLIVAKDAGLTLNALAAGYKYGVAGGVKQAREPELGISRLVAEALECLVAMLARGVDSEQEKAGHFAFNPSGTRYRTSLPRRT